MIRVDFTFSLPQNNKMQQNWHTPLVELVLLIYHPYYGKSSNHIPSSNSG